MSPTMIEILSEPFSPEQNNARTPAFTLKNAGKDLSLGHHIAGRNLELAFQT